MEDPRAEWPPGGTARMSARPITRRSVLQGGAALAGAVYLGGRWPGPAVADDSLVVPMEGGADFSFILRRREDFLRLQFDFANAKLNSDEGRLERIHAADPIIMRVGFPTQHLHEEAVYESDADDPDGAGLNASNTDNNRLLDENGNPLPDPPEPANLPLPGSLGSRLAGASRLVFSRDVDSVPFSVDALLDWAAWTPVLSLYATAPNGRNDPTTGPGTAAPLPTHTALELPWWLLLSPLPAGRWAHARTPVSALGRTELWHTGLVEPGGQAPGTSPRGPSHVRAIWSLDPDLAGYHSNPSAPPLSYGEGNAIGSEVGVPFRGPLAPADRADIVVSSTVDGSRGRPASGYDAIPIDVNLLMLTSMGGHLDATGAWPTGGNGTNTSLESWRHRASGGRDHYVRVVRKGYLYPFGHRASLIKVTERKFRDVVIAESQFGFTRRVAYLFQRYVIVVREPLKTYPAPGQPDGGWENPFSQIRITSLTTPVIDPPIHDFGIAGVQDLQIFTPTVEGVPFRFHMQGTDRDGGVHSFTAAAPFVLLDLAFDTTPPGGSAGAMESLESAYAAVDPEGPVRASDLGGQAIFMVDPTVIAAEAKAKPEHARAVTQQLSWKPVAGGHAVGNTHEDDDQPAFYPAIDYARLTLESAEALAGGSFGGPGGVPFRYRAGYLASDGFTSGPPQGLIHLEQAADVEAGPTVDFASNGTDRSGGSINPGFAPTQVNLFKGCGGGDPATIESAPPGEDFDPAEFFGGVGQFLGNLVLSALLPAKSLSDEDTIEISSELVDDALVTRMHFASEMKSFPDGDAPVFIAGRGAELPPGVTTPATLTLEAVITAPVGGGDASYRVLGEVKDFQIRLFGGAPFIQLVFASASFEVLPGQKPAFDIELTDVFFPEGSPLQMLAEIVNAFLSDSPFFINLQPTSVEAGLDLRLPTITLGALQIQNLGVFFSVTIPFLGEPVLVTFGIGTRDKPVAVTYMALGGGFWITLLLTADGVKAFELGVEVRASLEGSIGPFKAYATVAVGIIIAIGESPNSPDGEATLTGYFRASAGVSLVVVSVKIQIELSLTYVPAQEKAIGKVSVLVEVEVVFFSFSQSFEYERKFGGGSDPEFGQVYPNAADFEDYIDLFAAIPA